MSCPDFLPVPTTAGYSRKLSLTTALKYGIFFIFSGDNFDSFSGKILKISSRSLACFSGFLAKQYSTPTSADEVCKSH